MTIHEGSNQVVITTSEWYNEYDEHDDRKGIGSKNKGGFWYTNSENLNMMGELGYDSKLKIYTSGIDYINYNNTIYKMQIPDFSYSGVLTEVYDFANDKINVDETNNRLLQEKDLFTRENTTYLQLEEYLRKDVVSEYNIPTGDETEITFYKNVRENGKIVTREVTDKTKGLETGRLFVKFGASGTNENVIGESNLIEINLPYADRIETSSHYDYSVNGNTSEYAVSELTDHNYDVEVNTNTSFRVYGNEININEDSEDYITSGKEDGMNYFDININENMDGDSNYEDRFNQQSINYSPSTEKIVSSNGIEFNLNSFIFNNKSYGFEKAMNGELFYNEDGISIIPEHKFGLNITYNEKNYGNGDLFFVDDMADVDTEAFRNESLIISEVNIENDGLISVIKVTDKDNNELQKYIIVDNSIRDDISYTNYLETTRGSSQLETMSDNTENAIIYLENNWSYGRLWFDYKERFSQLTNLSEMDVTNFTSELQELVKNKLSDSIIANETIFFDIEEQLIDLTMSILPKENFEVTITNDLHDKITFGTMANIHIKHLPTTDGKYYGEVDIKIELFPKTLDIDNQLPVVYKLNISDEEVEDIQREINLTDPLDSTQLSSETILLSYDNIIRNQLDGYPMLKGYYDLGYRFETEGELFNSYEDLVAKYPEHQIDFRLNITVQTKEDSPLWFGYDIIEISPNIN